MKIHEKSKQKTKVKEINRNLENLKTSRICRNSRRYNKILKHANKSKISRTINKIIENRGIPRTQENLENSKTIQKFKKSWKTKQIHHHIEKFRNYMNYMKINKI